ncbi:MAG: (Fe-S)-binding protein [Bryobacteraceae bacterium]
MLLISYWKAYMLFSFVAAAAFALYSEPEHFTAWETLLCTLLIVASAAGFWYRFGPVWHRIWTAKKDADFSLHPLGRRVWDFFWEVLCQAKVIAQRPLPGLAHAFVFWGFCVFALVSLNHFAAAFGLSFLAPDGTFGQFYFDFAGIFALLVAISIAGLFVRRFFVRPIWLGLKVSYESGIIAFLIFLLMVTYIAAFFVPGESAASRSLWWIHSLTILAFMPLIPHTKHLHLVLSPFTIFLSRNGFSEIPPLKGDEDFGLVTGKDVTQLVSLQAYSCVECGRCTEHCPAANTGKVLNPKEVILGLRGYLNDLGPTSDEPLLGKYNSQEAAFQCTTCGACEFQCPVGIQHLPVIVGLRRGAVNTGSWEDEHGTKLFLDLERNGNALGLSVNERTKFIEKRELPIFDGSQEYCLWLGCMGAYDPKGREIIIAFTEVMRHLGTTFGVLRKEKCTGDPVRRLGNDLLFQQLAEENLEIVKQNQVTKIVSICPHCVRTISKDWGDFGDTPEIEHHSEFMARYKDKLPKSAGESVVYHDPCYLGRYRDVYEAPREVLALAGTVVEPPRTRERGFCCGAGGGLAFLGEEKGERVSHNRAKELMSTGAGIVGAACPFCNTMLRDGLAALSETPPQLLDIAQITALNIRGASVESPD